jgi:hypothetical protein
MENQPLSLEGTENVKPNIVGSVFTAPSQSKYNLNVPATKICKLIDDNIKGATSILRERKMVQNKVLMMDEPNQYDTAAHEAYETDIAIATHTLKWSEKSKYMPKGSEDFPIDINTQRITSKNMVAQWVKAAEEAVNNYKEECVANEQCTLKGNTCVLTLQGALHKPSSGKKEAGRVSKPVFLKDVLEHPTSDAIVGKGGKVYRVKERFASPMAVDLQRKKEQAMEIERKNKLLEAARESKSAINLGKNTAPYDFVDSKGLQWKLGATGKWYLVGEMGKS